MKKSLAKMQLGKSGLTKQFIEGLRKTFKNRKAVKVSLLRSYSRNREEARRTAEKLCDELRSIGNFKYKIVGFTISLKKWKK